MKRSFAVPLYVLMVFLSGALVGGMGYRLYTAKVIAAPSVQPQHRLTPEEWRKRRIAEMRSRLQLTDDQVAKVQAVYDETKQLVTAYNQRSKTELHAIHDLQTQKIRAVLSPTQRTEYDKLHQEREAKHQAAEEKKNHPAN